MRRREGTPTDVEAAGIPFECPYTVLLHDKEKQRRRQHLALIESSRDLILTLQGLGQSHPILHELSTIDAERRAYSESLP
jgi:hypothetical protein